MRKAFYDRPQMIHSYLVNELLTVASGFTSITCFEIGPTNPTCDIITE
jgi:hypothetical protein